MAGVPQSPVNVYWSPLLVMQPFVRVNPVMQILDRGQQQPVASSHNLNSGSRIKEKEPGTLEVNLGSNSQGIGTLFGVHLKINFPV